MERCNRVRIDTKLVLENAICEAANFRPISAETARRLSDPARAAKSYVMHISR
jgi:hypothetical protein